MKKLILDEILIDDQASDFYHNLQENVNSKRHNNTDDDKCDLSLLVKGALYEVNFQHEDEIACYIKRVA